MEKLLLFGSWALVLYTLLVIVVYYSYRATVFDNKYVGAIIVIISALCFFGMILVTQSLLLVLIYAVLCIVIVRGGFLDLRKRRKLFFERKEYRVYTNDDIWIIFDRKCRLWCVDTKTYAKVSLPLPKWNKTFRTAMPEVQEKMGYYLIEWLGNTYILRPFALDREDRVQQVGM